MKIKADDTSYISFHLTMVLRIRFGLEPQEIFAIV
jgi:hypothetical protein